VPTWGAVLRALHLPEVGGDTIWVDAGAAYDGLSDQVKARLADLHVTHDFRSALQRVGYDYPIVAHPIVKTHRETGKKILWVNFTQRPHIIGLDLAEGREILSIVLTQYQKPEYQVRFAWRPNSNRVLGQSRSGAHCDSQLRRFSAAARSRADRRRAAVRGPLSHDCMRSGPGSVSSIVS